MNEHTDRGSTIARLLTAIRCRISLDTLKQGVTLCYMVLLAAVLRRLPVNIRNISYLSVSELLEELEVTRQTLWRWRQEGKIPAGHRLRNRMVVFSAEEVEEIKAFANQIEPIQPVGEGLSQLKLFDLPSATSGGRR